MKKIIFATFLILVLSGCSLRSLTETRVITVIEYPELPPVPKVEKLQLLPCPPDRPRVWWEEKILKNDSRCKNDLKKNPKLTKNSNFIRNCMEHRIDTNSNIVIGYDKENQQCFVINREKIRSKLKQYMDRIDEVNRQREEWIKRNSENDKKSLTD